MTSITPTMPQVELGRSGLLVTRMGLGLAALGRPGYINLGHADDLRRNYAIGAMERQTHAVLDSAWEMGIRYFDAARSYGRAEQFLSSWLTSRQIAPDQVTVGSKWGYTYTADWQVQAEHHEIKEHSEPVLQRQVRESRQWLGAHLDLYQIHSATLSSGVLDNREVLTALAGLREEGLRIGLSLSGAGQSETLRCAMDVEFDGQPLFSAVQATWNLLAQEASDALKDAAAGGMGVIIKEALANGRLTPRNENPEFASHRRLLEQVAQRHDVTIDAVALAAVLAQPWAHLVLSGAATVAHLRSNVAALNLELRDDLDLMLAELREEPKVYWGIRSDLSWN